MNGRGEALVAVVTGGATGIGYAVAEALAREGYHAVVAGRRREVLDAAVDQLRTAVFVALPRNGVVSSRRLAHTAIATPQPRNPFSAITTGEARAFRMADNATPAPS